MSEANRDVDRRKPQVPICEIEGTEVGAPVRNRLDKKRFQFARRSSRIVRRRVHPMRSAITVAGIVLHSLTSAQMAGSNGSTADPTGGSALPTTVRTWRRDLRPGDLRRVGVVLPAGRHVLGVRAGSVPGRVLATFMVYDVFRAIAK